jgi:hypothetical protein
VTLRFGRVLILAGMGVAILIIGVMAYIVYRVFEPDHQLRTYENIRLVLDSEEVESLIAKQNSLARQDLAEVDRYARLSSTERGSYEQYIPERIAFLRAMAQAPSVPIPANSFCRLLQDSNAICSPRPLNNPMYVKVRITSGPMKGHVGWGCEGIVRTVIWP